MMLEKLNFENTNGLTEECEVMADKIDEIIDAVNNMKLETSHDISKMTSVVSKLDAGLLTTSSVISCDKNIMATIETLEAVQAKTDNLNCNKTNISLCGIEVQGVIKLRKDDENVRSK